jgi:type IV pilus assembly protein PilB
MIDHVYHGGERRRLAAACGACDQDDPALLESERADHLGQTIAKRLVRKLCERCKEPVEIEREILEGMEFPFGLASEGLHFHKAVGCRRCGGSGYRGRTRIYELMVISDEIRKMILLRSSAGEISSVAESQGMVRLRDDGLLKAAEGITTIEEALKTL